MDHRITARGLITFKKIYGPPFDPAQQESRFHENLRRVFDLSLFHEIERSGIDNPAFRPECWPYFRPRLF